MKNTMKILSLVLICLFGMRNITQAAKSTRKKAAARQRQVTTQATTAAVSSYQTPQEKFDQTYRNLVTTITTASCYNDTTKKQLLKLLEAFVKENTDKDDLFDSKKEQCAILITLFIELQEAITKLITSKTIQDLPVLSRASFLHQIAEIIRQNAKASARKNTATTPKEEKKSFVMSWYHHTFERHKFIAVVAKTLFSMPKKALFFSLKTIIQVMLLHPETKELLIDTTNLTLVGLEIQNPQTARTLVLRGSDLLFSFIDQALSQNFTPLASAMLAPAQPVPVADEGSFNPREDLANSMRDVSETENFDTLMDQLRDTE